MDIFDSKQGQYTFIFSPGEEDTKEEIEEWLEKIKNYYPGTDLAKMIETKRYIKSFKDAYYIIFTDYYRFNKQDVEYFLDIIEKYRWLFGKIYLHCTDLYDCYEYYDIALKRGSIKLLKEVEK